MIRKNHDFSQLLMLVPVFVVVYFSFLWRNYEFDDAFIYLRYIRNFQEGYGLVYNIGEKFNGLTSPLFTLIVLTTSFLIKNLQVAIIVISSLFMAIASIVAAKIFSSNKYEATFTSITIGSFSYFYSTFGIETPLFLMLIAISLYLYKIDSIYFVIALALLVITRNEGVFLAAPMVVDYVVRNRRLPSLMLTIVAAVIFLSPFLFNYLYYGYFFPATANAKILQGKSGYWGEHWISNFFSIVYGAFSNSKNAALFFLVFSAYGAFTLIRNRIALLGIIFCALLLLFYGGLNIPNYHWYHAPFFLLMLIFFCRGIGRLSSILLRNGWFDDRAYIFLLLVVGIVFSYSKVISLTGGGSHESYAKIGIWIKQNTDKNISVGMVEIGIVGWYADRHIIDILGLVNKYNADYIGKGDLYSWLNHYRPDYILRHEPRWVFEASTKILEQTGTYMPVSSFNFPGYVLLKKSEKYNDDQILETVRSLNKK